MSLSNTDFVDYALSLNPGLFHAYMQGHLRDLSGNGNHGIPQTTPVWMRNKRGHMLDCYRETGGLVVPDAPSIRAGNSNSILVFGNFANLSHVVQDRFLSKRDALDTDYEFRLNTATTLYLRTGMTNTWCAGLAITNAVSVGVTWVVAAVARFYINGLFVGVGNISTVAGIGAAPLCIGQYHTSAACSTVPFHATLFYKGRVLTEEQISDLHRLYLEDARGVPTAPARTISLPPRDLHGAALYLAGPKNALGDVVDRSGNGLDAAVTGRVGEEREHVSGARVQHFHGAGAGVVTVPVSALLSQKPAQSIGMLVRIDGDGQSGEGTLFSLEFGGNRYRRFTTINANDYRFYMRFSDGEASWIVPTRPGDTYPHHLLVTHDGSPTSRPVASMNGRVVTLDVRVGRTGTLSSTPNESWWFGNRRAHNRTLDGVEGCIKFFDYALSPDQVRTEYLQHATRAIELAPRRAYPVTLANIAAGRCGPWDVCTGTWSYQDDGVKRKLVNVVTGFAVVPSAQAYGAWYFTTSLPAGRALRFGFIWGLRVPPAHAPVIGYYFYVDQTAHRIMILTSDAAVYVIDSTAFAIDADVDYEFFITRDYTGRFVLWLRGGAYPTWVLVGARTNNTITASQWLSARLDAGITLATFRTYPLGDTLDPRTEVPGLED